MYPHRIRLRGPWECQPLRRHGEGSLPSLCRMAMPCRWSEGGLPDFSGLVRFTRSFGYPGRIDSYERVWLTFAAVGGEAEVRLNGQPLGRLTGPTEFEVTRLLRPRNELIVEIEGTAEQGGLPGEVALEVRCSAFLRDLRWNAILTGERLTLCVTGQVIGEAERPLEVYVLRDRSTVGYQVVRAAAEGQPFTIRADDLPTTEAVSVPVQIDLVNGGVVWYSEAAEVRVANQTNSGE